MGGLDLQVRSRDHKNSRKLRPLSTYPHLSCRHAIYEKENRQSMKGTLGHYIYACVVSLAPRLLVLVIVFVVILLLMNRMVFRLFGSIDLLVLFCQNGLESCEVLTAVSPFGDVVVLRLRLA